MNCGVLDRALPHTTLDKMKYIRYAKAKKGKEKSAWEINYIGGIRVKLRAKCHGPNATINLTVVFEITDLYDVI